MKRGLSIFLKITLSLLISVIIIAFASYNFTTPGKYNLTESIDVDSDALITSTPLPEADDADASETAVPEHTQVPDNSKAEEATAAPKATATPKPTMDPDTWDYIMISGDANMHYTDKEKKPKVMPYEIHVNKLMNCITVYKRTKKGKYTKPVKAMVCSAGSDTPLGTFHTSSKYYWKAMIHKVWAQYATRITGKILFHSVPYDTHRKDTLITNYYNQLGRTASAGCVRLSVADAKWIMENCPSGTTVVIYNSYDPGPLGKPSPIQIPYNCKWDPTDPDTRNPWNSDKTDIIGVRDRTIERGSGINYLDGVIAYDIAEKKMSTSNIKVKTNCNSSKPGKYTVKYSFIDSKGRKIKKKAIFTVVDRTAPRISGIPTTYYVQDKSKITTKTLYSKLSVTDNGYSISKEKYVKISLSGNIATIIARDMYGNTSTLKCKIIEDNKPPVITLKNNLKNRYPVSHGFTSGWARKRIKKVTDNISKLNANNVSISTKPSSNSVKIIYTVSDNAGNKSSVSETINLEKVIAETYEDNMILQDIDDTDELLDNIYVYSENSGDDIDCNIKVKRKRSGSDDAYDYYTVTYNIVYRSAAGKKSLTKTASVRVPK